MSDPVFEAAQRAWMERYPSSGSLGALAIAAAREAVDPIRELHHRVRLYSPVWEEVCDDHDTFEIGSGDYYCRTCTDGEIYVCAECYEEDGNGSADWPCATAELVYTTEELER